ncbi:c-type cytochrome [Roseateles flavus]|uniref:Cytochrome c n=1 Tax=Roseateles flavus TaxID=3149041 RepID=A0ABV0G817_9BURK
MKAALTLLLAAWAACPALVLADEAASAPEPRFSSGWRFEQRSGPALYGALCAACHMPDGRGARGAGAYPALQGNPRLAAAPYALHMVLNGHRAMPGFGRQLSDDQVAAVLSHVRERFGGMPPEAARVTPAESAEVRKGQQASPAVAH